MVRTITLLMAGLATAGCNSNRSVAADAVAEIRTADAALSDAVSKQDLERIASFYADDAVLMPMAETIVAGKAAIRKEWSNVLGIPGMQNVSVTKRIDASRSGDMGYSRGTYTSTMVGNDGRPVTEPGKWVSVWAKQSDGNWRIVVDTYNTDIMPPTHKESTAH